MRKHTSCCAKGCSVPLGPRVLFCDAHAPKRRAYQIGRRQGEVYPRDPTHITHAVCPACDGVYLRKRGACHCVQARAA